jgi:hypothetical protein
MAQQFFYDGQIRRFIIQFIRIVSNFQVEFGKDRTGNTTLQTVPVFYGDSSRQVAAILKSNSDNTIHTVPSMAVYVSSLSYDRERVQEPNFVSKMNIRQKFYNEDSQSYENRQGDAFTVERHMPVPYKLELKLDIWTSNTEQKLQLIEQLGTLFNPALEIQSTDNYIDWSSLSAVFLTGVNWSSRSVPINTDNPIDIATLTFDLPIWISAPSKVKKLGVIHKIISSIYDGTGDLDLSIADGTKLLGDRQYFTPLDYGVILLGNQLQLLRVEEMADPRDPTALSQTKVTGNAVVENWKDLISVYGELTAGFSQIRLEMDDGQEVVGTVAFHPSDPHLMLFTPDIDTLPVNSIESITSIVDPTAATTPDKVATKVTGTRFLLLNAVGDYNTPSGYGSDVWRGTDSSDLIANANDVVEWSGTKWEVTFDSVLEKSVQYTTNLTTGVQYQWTGSQWVKSYEGEYKNGQWSLVL